MRYVLIVIAVIAGVAVYYRMRPEPDAVRTVYANGVTFEGVIGADGAYTFDACRVGGDEQPVRAEGVFIRTTGGTVIDLAAVDKAVLLAAGGVQSNPGSGDALKANYITIDDLSACLVRSQVMTVEISGAQGNGCGIGRSAQGPFSSLPLSKDQVEQLFGMPDSTETFKQ